MHCVNGSSVASFKSQSQLLMCLGRLILAAVLPQVLHFPEGGCWVCVMIWSSGKHIARGFQDDHFVFAVVHKFLPGSAVEIYGWAFSGSCLITMTEAYA